MKSTIASTSLPVSNVTKDSFLVRFARRQVLKKLENLKHGCLQINDAGQILQFGDMPDCSSCEDNKLIVVRVHDSSFWLDVAFSGGLGAAESYMRGHWTCNDLTELLRLMVRNNDISDQLDTRFYQLRNYFLKVPHFFNRNTLKGSRRNIEAHYDLSNDFFELFLDQTMMYSAAYYDDENTSLEKASIAKIEKVCQKLEIQPEDHLLEIGTGWGAMALHAAKEYGCQVTTTTLSKEQYHFAKSRIADAGLSHRVTVLLKDYRELEGKYDKIVSIEMVEAVGHQFLDTYFKHCNELLKPSGKMLLQAITISDHRYKDALKRVDFIKKYIFPGGFLPSVAALSGSISKQTRMKVIHLEDIGQHYARTLHDWKKRFMNRLDEVAGQGYSKQFIRMWEYYLDYCRAGFTENQLGTVQVLLLKDGNSPS